jgi:hypothetical protein
LTLARKTLAYLRTLIHNWVSAALVILGLGSTLLTYIPSFYPKFQVPKRLPLVCIGAAFLWGSFRLFLSQSGEIEHLSRELDDLRNEKDVTEKSIRAEWHAEITTLRQQILATQDDTHQKWKRTITSLISELEGNMAIAYAPYSGSPGNAVFLRPSIRIWTSARNGLEFLPSSLSDYLADTYRQTERWYGIVESGANPGIGNQEVDQITARLRGQLPQLMAQLKKFTETLTK